MEEYEQEEKKPIENWNGDERRHGPSDAYKGDERRHGPSDAYKGDERRRSEAANDSTDAVGVKPPIGDSDADEGEGR